MSFLDKILGYLKKPSPAKEGRIDMESGAQIVQGGVDGAEISDNPAPSVPEPVQPLVKDKAQPMAAASPSTTSGQDMAPVTPSETPVVPEPSQVPSEQPPEEVIAEAPIETAAPVVPEPAAEPIKEEAPVVPEPVSEPVKEEVPIAPKPISEPAPATPEPVTTEPVAEVPTEEKGPDTGGAAPATSIEELEKRMDGPEPKIIAQEGGPEAANGGKTE